MKNVTESELWDLVVQIGELQAKVLQMIRPEPPPSKFDPTYAPPVIEPTPARPEPKDKDVPF